MEVTRIVRLVFKPELIEKFMEIYNSSYELIRYSPGCTYLELMRDQELENVYYTYSKWQSDQDLQEYRKSELFSRTWAKTKLLFDDKPQAFSLTKII
jgi:hypothetical protein